MLPAFACMEQVKEKTIEAKAEQGLNARKQRQLACVRVYEAMVSNHGVRAKSSLLLHVLALLQNVPTALASAAFTFDRRRSGTDTAGTQVLIRRRRRVRASALMGWS